LTVEPLPFGWGKRNYGEEERRRERKKEEQAIHIGGGVEPGVSLLFFFFPTTLRAEGPQRFEFAD